MALPASSLLSPYPKFQIKLFRNQPCRFNEWPVLFAHSRWSPVCSMKITNADFGDPNKVKLQLIGAAEKLWDAAPNDVKEFPWKDATDMMIKRLLVVGQNALKWSLLALFLLSSISDVVFSVSRNQELMIPVGLFIGCLIADFLKETLQEIFRASEDDKGSNLTLLTISCLFVLVKFISAYFTARTQVLLLHVANGGFLQVLYLWRYLWIQNDERNKENFSTDQDASLAAESEK